MANFIAGYPTATAKRIKWALAIVVTLIFVLSIYRFTDQQNSKLDLPDEYRIPITIPEIEPTRPDLKEEPRIDEPQ